MDVKAGQAERFLKALPKSLAVILFYGSDAGLVSERAAQTAKVLATDPKAPGDILRLDDADLANDPDRLGVELRTIAMFGGRKIVRLKAEARLKPELVSDLLDGGPLEGILIVEAANLKPDSKLRSLIAEAASGAAIACYADDERSLADLVDQVLREHRLTAASEVREHLVSLLGADRSLSRNELEKLALYLGDGKQVAIEDIEAIVGDASELGLDAIANATASGAAADALRTLDRADAAGESPQTVILALLRHFMRLHMLASAVAAGTPLAGALRSLRPPLHFKQQDQVQAQLRGWSVARLGRAIGAIQTTAKAARLSSSLERTLAEELILDLSRLAAERG